MESKENKSLSPAKHLSVSGFFTSVGKLMGSRYEKYFQRNSANPDSRKTDKRIHVTAQ